MFLGIMRKNIFKKSTKIRILRKKFNSEIKGKIQAFLTHPEEEIKKQNHNHERKIWLKKKIT